MKQSPSKYSKRNQEVILRRHTSNKLIKPWQLLLTTVVGFITPIHSHYYGDKGLIGYFEGDCPEGWELYQPLTGRVPVGVGNYIGTAEDGRTEAKIYYLNNTGGEIEHSLTASEMPKHDHSNGDYKALLKSDCQDTIGTNRDSTCGEVNLLSYKELLPVGESQPHNNMPPYLVLTPCQKMASFGYIDQNNFLAIQKEVERVIALIQALQPLQQEVVALKQQLKTNELQANNSKSTIKG